jgi:cytochrome b561
MSSAIVFQTQSALILLMLFVGVYFRRQTKRHVKIMTSAIVWDILLVLQIELNRGAIAKAVEVTQNKWLLNFHVSLAVTCVLCYGVMFFTGRQMLKQNFSWRSWHKNFGLLTLFLRVATFVTSFLVK